MAPVAKPFREPRYLLRFDDICPTMNWKVWDVIEGMLIQQDVSPILAVVPDNRDPKLMVDPPSQAFWDRVRGWQARGWTIGLHGYQHRYVNTEPGILRLNNQSEFAGLDYEAQSEKIRRGLSIFSQEGVLAECWVAPAHSFDWVTVSALADQGIRVISDGFAFAPYRDGRETVWVPQQFARMRSMPPGIWTFCYHHNRMTSKALKEFHSQLKRLGPRMITLSEAAAMGTNQRSSADLLVGAVRNVLSRLRYIGKIANARGSIEGKEK